MEFLDLHKYRNCSSLCKHKGDSETYYILSGTGRYNDNGSIVDVHPGDVYFCEDGESHSIEATNEPIEMVALILYH